MIHFDFSSLTPNMRFFLSWLIQNGGHRPQLYALRRANRGAKPVGIRITTGTLRALFRRGYLEHDADMRYVQVAEYAVTDACQYIVNPDPDVIMRVRAEPVAWQEHADRIADAIRDAWANRDTHTTTEGDNV